MKKIIKAWAVVDSRGQIPENNDDPKFMCVHKRRCEAINAKKEGELIVKISIVFEF